VQLNLSATSSAPVKASWLV